MQMTYVSLAGRRWQVTSTEGTSETVDGLILTLPPPQVLQLTGTIRDIIDAQPVIKRRLEQVEYSCRFAMGLFYEPGTKLDIPWCAKYIADDDCLRFISIDSAKRGIENPDVGPSVVVHTSVPFGLTHIEADKSDVCSNVILPRVLQRFPEFPQPADVKNHKWRYSQVFKYYEGTPGMVVLHEDPLLVLGGDAFTRSRFDGCIDSAVKIAETVISCSERQNNT